MEFTFLVWLSVQMRRLYDRYFSQDWMSRMGEPDIWSEIYNVDPGELWETHNIFEDSDDSICEATGFPR